MSWEGKRSQTTRKGLKDIRTQQYHRNVEREPAKRQTRHPYQGQPNQLSRMRPRDSQAQTEMRNLRHVTYPRAFSLEEQGLRFLTSRPVFSLQPNEF